MKLPFKNTILSWIIRKRFHQIELFLKYPCQIQKQILLDLMYCAQDTMIGKKYKFSSIRSYETFRKNVPVVSYEEFYPLIKKIRDGQGNVLWPGKPEWFAKSAGTTNSNSKYIPITKDSLIDCHYKVGKDMLSIYCNNFPDTSLFNGFGLMFSGSQYKDPTKRYIDADISTILLKNFPLWVDIHRTPDIKTALMSQWEEKLDKILEQSIKQNVTSITGAPSWMLILLKRVLKETNTKNILNVWPNLELCIHGGMNFGPYRQQFQNLIPSNQMQYMECYNASEGYFAIQDQPKKSDMLLMLDYGIFYEFIEIEDLKNGNRYAIPIDEVKLNKIYALVISTNSGLFRYLIGDTIQFTSLSPFRIKIVGRTKSFINAFGEELIVENVEDAVAYSCKKTNAIVTEFTVAPVYINKDISGAHEWLIEFEKTPDNIKEFEKEVDHYLKKINSDYLTKRKNNLILQPPIFKILKKGSF